MSLLRAVILVSSHWPEVLAMPSHSDGLSSLVDLFPCGRAIASYRSRSTTPPTDHGLEAGPHRLQKCPAGFAPVPESPMAGFQCLATCAERLALRGMYGLNVPPSRPAAGCGCTCTCTAHAPRSIAIRLKTTPKSPSSSPRRMRSSSRRSSPGTRLSTRRPP